MSTNNSINSQNPVEVAQGGTGLATITAHGIMVGEGTSAVTPIALTNGELLIGSTGANPVAATLTAGTNVTITNAAGSITIAASGGGGGSVGWTEITQTVISGSPGSIYFTSSDIVNYQKLKFTFTGLTFSGSDALYMAPSNNGGSTYSVPISVWCDGTSTGGFEGSITQLITAIDSFPLDGWVIIENNTDGLGVMPLYGMLSTSGSASQNRVPTGYFQSTTQLNAFRLLLGVNSFSAGTITLSGQ